MVMAIPTYAELRTLSDDELIARYDNLATNVAGSVNFYLAELERRQAARHAAKSLTYAVFADAGFVRPCAAAAAGVDKEQVGLDGEALVTTFRRTMLQRFLRAYVYDANFREQDVASDRDRAERRRIIAEQHERLSEVRGVQLRLGTLVGKPVRQKGVDTRLVLDMVDLAQQGAYDIAVLFGGDSDLAGVVETVQRIGKTVCLVLPETNASSWVSRELLVLADEEFHMTEASLASLVYPLPKRVALDGEP